jgi:hypothetical protein
MVKLSNYAKMIEWALNKYPDCDIFGSLSPNQISSKIWLIENLTKICNKLETTNHKIEIVGSWYGYPLIEYLKNNISIEKIECWDIDKEARMIAKKYIEIFNNDNTFVYSKNYWHHLRTASEATILINTSSEHMVESFYQVTGKWDVFYHKKPIIVIQSNNMYHIDEHINCVDSEEELIDKHKIREVLYSGSQNIVEWYDEKIEESKYKRFMVIGQL